MSALAIREQAAQLATVERYEGLTMVTSAAEAKRRVQELQAFVQSVMVSGVDFGVIPGTGDKPALFQPGAQKLAELYGFSHNFEDTGSALDWEKPFFLFRKRCILTSRRDGGYVGDGIGSCNSREDRYAYRWVGDRDLPKGVDKASLRSKQRTGRNGSWTTYRMPNEDIFSLVNTIEKMACKRAYVHAVISVTRSSGMFTQDVEDLPPEAFGEVDGARQWEKGREDEARTVEAPTEPPSISLADRATFDSFAERFSWIAKEGDRKQFQFLCGSVKKAHLPKSLETELLSRAKATNAVLTAREAIAAEKAAAYEPKSDSDEGPAEGEVA
jgi:hypothetical protein